MTTKIIIWIGTLAITAGLVSAGLLTSMQQDAKDSTMNEAIETTTDSVNENKFKPKYSSTGHDITPLDKKTIYELAKKLTEEERRILLRKGTEPSFCGNLLDNKIDGTYLCRLCGLPLFSSEDKFNSGTGWPSYSAPVDKDHIIYERDTSLGRVRTEIMCQRCGGHLGHVFDDGPEPTGQRYCLNSASLEFVKKGDPMPEQSQPVKTDTAFFAGGCFWGVEDQFQQVPGVLDAVSGYQGGDTEKPTYKQVCTGTTNHAEAVRVTFDPKRVTYTQLLTVFFKVHDPTQVNRQGPDQGTQYRSAIFTTTPEQTEQALVFIEKQSATERFTDREIATVVKSVEEAGPFYEAEEYHQDYHEKHGGSCAVPEG